MNARHTLDVALMRGGTSRGAVLPIEAAPTPGPRRDELARSLIGGVLVDGLGGGSPTTSKVVLVGKGTDVDFDYIVGNVAADASVVDWSGTCGNMTAAVVPYAAMAGLLSDNARTRYRLRNLATQRPVDIEVHDPRSLQRPGNEVGLTTTYLEPGGAVLGKTLPTAQPVDLLEVDGATVKTTIVDVAHPYLFVRFKDALGDTDVSSPEAAERIERIRSAACVRLGLSASAEEARYSSAAVPRIVLLHQDSAPADVRITAISMGQPIRSVPVTAAMCLAAARQIAGTLVAGPDTGSGDTETRVIGPAGEVRARAETDRSGHVLSTSVRRDARCIMRGTVWA
ncbi:PrpF domain-containing protein [uncultured Jatrophihabitans sp.]|uniref:PrpF domain-containing protein n=1 Tax=uncultured Jatrophihabitans sp. TaxID=1610747 RepID=UPI0035CA1399